MVLTSTMNNCHIHKCRLWIVCGSQCGLLCFFGVAISWRLGQSFNSKGIHSEGWCWMVTKILARYHLPEVPSLAAAGLVPVPPCVAAPDHVTMYNIRNVVWRPAAIVLQCGRCCVNCKYTVNIVNTVNTRPHQPPFYFRQPSQSG